MWRLVALMMLPAVARAQSTVPVGCTHWFDGACLPRWQLSVCSVCAHSDVGCGFPSVTHLTNCLRLPQGAAAAWCTLAALEAAAR